MVATATDRRGECRQGSELIVIDTDQWIDFIFCCAKARWVAVIYGTDFLAKIANIDQKTDAKNDANKAEFEVMGTLSLISFTMVCVKLSLPRRAEAHLDART